jgi:hypothetical protein
MEDNIRRYDRHKPLIPLPVKERGKVRLNYADRENLT